MNLNKEICGEDENKKCDKLINRYLLRGKKFVDYACFQYGAYNVAISGKADAHFIDDFQYFVFTKSTKSLEAIRILLKNGKYEDVLIILRSMFEGYLASRFIDEKYDRKLLDDFIFLPQLIAENKTYYDFHNKSYHLKDNKQTLDYKQRTPSEMKLGKDKKYYRALYDYLCLFSHCNYAILPHYIDENGCFDCDIQMNSFMVKILVLFTYTKIFESIVTVEGEDFLNEREEKECYKLVKDATIYLDSKLEDLGNYNSSRANPELNNKMKKMFTEMRQSLKEKIGSVNKDFLDNM